MVLDTLQGVSGSTKRRLPMLCQVHSFFRPRPCDPACLYALNVHGLASPHFLTTLSVHLERCFVLEVGQTQAGLGCMVCRHQNMYGVSVQVDGCNKDLSVEKEYYQRYRICEEHLKLSSLLKDGLQQRFCQQCGRFHLLSDFDGDKRCRSNSRI